MVTHAWNWDILSKKNWQSFTQIFTKPHLYFGDLPNISSLRSKVHSWYIKWKSEEIEHGSGSLPSALNSTLSQTSNYSPNIKALITILCILPVTSCTAERSFSGLKGIKTALRSTMSNERLSNIALVHLHQDIPIDIDEVIDEFSRLHPRRIQLSDFWPLNWLYTSFYWSWSPLI